MALEDFKKTKELLRKKPFTRVTALRNYETPNILSSADWVDTYDQLELNVVTQAEFLREFFPTGHKINDPTYYPDKLKIDEKTGRYFTEKVIRCSFPFQKVITVKHLCHLCGNDIQFELSNSKDDKSESESFFEFRRGWLSKNMEIIWYEAAKSSKITGDCAIVGFLKNGKFYAKTLSYLNGDMLYPHFDSITGELSAFARLYSDYDKDSREVTRWVEVWDETHLHLFKQDVQGLAKVKNIILDMFGLDGYKLIESSPHNFDSIPVAYYRNDNGPCWSDSQDSIDKYELAVSHLCQNNMAYAFPIMYLKGDDVTIEADMAGSVKAITMGENDEAGFLDRPQSYEAFDVQLKILLQNIFIGSFAVLPPEVKAGDLPGVAVKLLYSPAVEQAMMDASEYNPLIDKIISIFKYGYGIECGKLSDFENLDIFGWIKPYVHQNDIEIFQNASVGVQNGFVSKQSASEKVSDLGYGINGEWDRILKEKKEEQQNDLLIELKSQENTMAMKQKANSSNNGSNKNSNTITNKE